MPITNAEAKKLQRQTGLQLEAFSYVDDEGIRRLLNNSDTKACVFLAVNDYAENGLGVCKVYESRPLGCRLFPIVLNEQDVAILDELCPHRTEFPMPQEEDGVKLLLLEEKLKTK